MASTAPAVTVSTAIATVTGTSCRPVGWVDEFSGMTVSLGLGREMGYEESSGCSLGLGRITAASCCTDISTFLGRVGRSGQERALSPRDEREAGGSVSTPPRTILPERPRPLPEGRPPALPSTGCDPVPDTYTREAETLTCQTLSRSAPR